ncbi:hypothetical protein COY93_01465 [Candidatus Uhrbacteria bacterium CG_4_10_14_0_8_um_filter_58_22]|uniref:Uncharacterized protein n=1 Tax=Candidatus Uhrbacteria bacterium CG_4_10_14_0_8_um_filter_58_22 TaxID=1975029 RepID=A0A2M7QBI5_9BACT|nr:MAG: hypothetical protein AUJ19_01780 [Parcubacteria group bacterium CG1_02_58_44]PIY63071.1 MAG: hypothetical protein COY93_01465 [Candidatus Uhrbacteria bacterium CG_4_10_14_0_8_um_filter_58_22]
MKKCTQYAAAVLIGLILTVTTLFVPVRASTTTEVRNVSLGLPIRFVMQDLSATDHDFPARVTFSSPWENPTKVSWGWLALDLTMFSLLAMLVIGQLERNKKGA